MQFALGAMWSEVSSVEDAGNLRLMSRSTAANAVYSQFLHSRTLCRPTVDQQCEEFRRYPIERPHGSVALIVMNIRTACRLAARTDAGNAVEFNQDVCCSARVKCFVVVTGRRQRQTDWERRIKKVDILRLDESLADHVDCWQVEYCIAKRVVCM